MRRIRRDNSPRPARRSAPGEPNPTFPNSEPSKARMADLTAPVPATDARRMRLAARALARAGLVHAYGHCSLRIDSEQFIVSPPKALGLVGPNESPVTVTKNGSLPADAMPEVISLQQLYSPTRGSL